MKRLTTISCLLVAVMSASAQAQDATVLDGTKSSVAASNRHHYEISGSLFFLQAGAGNLEYATLVSPLPLPTPNWSNQSLKPEFSPAFHFGLRYIPTVSNDFQLNWTHLKSSAEASVVGSPTQMVGPPFQIGPTASSYQLGRGNVSFTFDSVNLDVGHTFCAGCPFQLRVFGGAEFARIEQNLTGAFSSTDGLTTASNATSSVFTGVGPRSGIRGQYGAGAFQVFGEAAVALLIGTTQSRIDFSHTSTAAPELAQPNNQALTSPNETQIVPSFDAKVGTTYVFAPTQYGQFKIELGYQAAVYMNAVNRYALTQVPLPPAPATVGVFLATAEHLQTNFTAHGPYMTASWLF